MDTTGIARGDRVRRRRAGLGLAVLAAAWVTGCAGGGAMTGAGGDAPPTGAAVAAPTAAPTTGGGEAAGDPGAAGTNGREAAARDGARIVRTGELHLEVGDLGGTLMRARAAVDGIGGYIAGSEESQDGERARASVTYRVPEARWGDAVAALRGLAQKVLGETTHASDVTTQLVDMNARLTNLRATEASLQAIMAKATTIPDVLTVQRELNTVREQIERIDAQRAALEDQAAYGTLTVSWTVPAPAEARTASTGWSLAAEVDRGLAQAIQLGQGVASFAVWFLFVGLPLLALLGGTAALAWLASRWFRRRAMASR